MHTNEFMVNMGLRLINLRTLPFAAFILSVLLLAGALAFEHWGHLAPCQMCYWQRHAHKAVLAFAGLAILVRFLSKSDTYMRGFAALIGLAFLVSFALAFWHVGVEYGWWTGPKSCLAAPVDISRIDMDNVFDTPIKGPACSDVPWSLLGISMAGYNGLLSMLAALFCFRAIRRAK